MRTRLYFSFLFFLGGVFTLGSYTTQEVIYKTPIPLWRWLFLIFLTSYFFLDLGNTKYKNNKNENN